MTRLSFSTMSVLIASITSGAEVRAETHKLREMEFLREYIATGRYSLGRPLAAQPTPDGKAILFLRSSATDSRRDLYIYDIETRSTTRVLTAAQLLGGAKEELSPEEMARRERLRLTARGFTSFHVGPDGDLLVLPLSGKLYTYRRSTGESKSLPTGEGTLIDPQLFANGSKIAYVLDYDVHVLDIESGEETRVTTGGMKDISHGIAEFVAQEEMGRLSGFWPSPDGRYIAFQETDSREVEVWSVSDPGNPGAAPYTQRYPRPGRKNVSVRLGIARPGSDRIVWADWNREKYPYLATVKWPKGGPLMIGVQDRLQQEYVIFTVNPRSGRLGELHIERDEQWINLDQSFPNWLSKGPGFLWKTERRGGPQLELRSQGGSLEKILTDPDLNFTGLVSVDEEAGVVYFTGGSDPTERHLFKVDLDTARVEQFSKEPGLHSAKFSKNHSVYVHQSSGPSAIARTEVRDASGQLIGELPSVSKEPPFSPSTEYVTVDNDMALYCSITRPRDFEAGKKYPVILDVYGGPRHLHVLKSMGSGLLAQWYADQGFIVIAIDGRGTPGRGRDWERSIYEDFSTAPLEDQITGLQALGRKYPELDMDRIGVKGWSFGGYMSGLAVLRRPDVFKVAVAGAPVVDWEDYDTHYTERYLGLPDANKTGYKASNLLTYANELRRPLLLVHGTRDDNVFYLHSLKLSDALFRAGRPHQMLPLLGYTHMVSEPKTRVKLEQTMARFLMKHLK